MHLGMYPGTSKTWPEFWKRIPKPSTRLPSVVCIFELIPPRGAILLKGQRSYSLLPVTVGWKIIAK